MNRALLAAAVLLPLTAAAQVATDPSIVYDRIQAMVPMRDGVRLETDIYVPKAAREKLPILFMRTPYGFSPDAKGFSLWLTRPWLVPTLRDGYVLALQNVRGRFGSEGVFSLAPAPRDRSDPKATDESTDAWDTVDWLLASVPSNNGRVGMLGVSNPGGLVAFAMLEPHPAVRAYSPQAVPADNFIGDDAFHQGAFRLMPMAQFIPEMEAGKTFADPPFDRVDLYDWFLSQGPVANLEARLFRGRFPTWKEFIAHPRYDDFWKRRSLPALVGKVPAPVLNVGGAYDQEDRRGPVALYEALERADPANRSVLVVGPWAHRTWRMAEGDRLGRISFGSPTARWFREEVQAPFFACALKDRCGPPLPEALVFQTGTNVWQRLDAWPPRGTKERSVWLAPGGRLALDGPPREEGEDAWVSDPAHPVPYQATPIVSPHVGQDAWDETWATWMVADQRFLAGRPDVLSWVSEPLAEDVAVAGPIAAHLFVSTTGSDADFAAKLIDVYPEKVDGDPTLGGYQLMVAAEILRGRFRRGFEKPEPFTPGEVEAVSVDLLTRSHVFAKGHRIMVQVQSTWFPLYDRNPQTFVPSIFEAREGDYRAQTHRVLRSRRHPSRVTFATAPVH